jgi:hypothetical protein
VLPALRDSAGRRYYRPEDVDRFVASRSPKTLGNLVGAQADQAR